MALRQSTLSISALVPTSDLDGSSPRKSASPSTHGPSPALLEKLNQLEQALALRLGAEDTLPTRFEPREKFLLRFLKSCQGDVEETVGVILDHVRWRRENKVDEIALKTLEELLGDADVVQQLVSCMPILERGEDVDGRPVLYMIASKLDARTANKLVTPEKVFQYQTWIRERALARLDLYGKGHWRNPPYYTFVTDLRGVRLNQATGEFYSLMKRIMDLDQYHYPGRVGLLVIINVPFFFQMIWGALRGWLGSSTEKKIVICYRESEAKRILLSLIPQAQLPHDLGGAAISLPTARQDTPDVFFCPKVHFSKISSLATAHGRAASRSGQQQQSTVATSGGGSTTSTTMAEPTKAAPSDIIPDRTVERKTDKSRESEPLEAVGSPEVAVSTPSEPGEGMISLDTIVRESMERAAKHVGMMNGGHSADSQAIRARNDVVEHFRTAVQQKENLEELKNELVKAIAQVEHETNQFERDVLMVRDRLRRRLQRVRAGGLDGQATTSTIVFPKGVQALQQMLAIVEEERDAHARAVAFARNYIDVEAQEWDQTQRSLRARLERVNDEHRGLVRTVQVALGQDVLDVTLRSARDPSQ